MVNALFNLESQIFFLFGHHFDCPGSVSIRIHFDPDPKHCFKDIDWGLPGSSENHQAFCKMLNSLFNLKSLIFYPFFTSLWLSRIRNTGLNYQQGCKFILCELQALSLTVIAIRGVTLNLIIRTSL